LRVLGWIRLGLTDLRGDLGRFGILLACLFLGTGIVAIVGSVGSGLRHAVARDAIVLAGGDLDAAPLSGHSSPADAAFLSTLGEVTRIVDSTAQGIASESTGMIDLLAVSDNYPAAGTLGSPQLEPGQRAYELIRKHDGVYGALVDERLLGKLGVQLEGRFKIGGTEFQARGLIASLPDGATRGFELGYPAIISIEAYDTMANWRAPLPGLLTHDRYKLKLTAVTFEAAAEAIKAHFGAGVWIVRSPREVVGNIARYYDLFAKFTLIVGLSSLLIGGVGVSNGVSAYVGDRQRTIAILRSLGATGPRIVVHFLTQISVLSLAGVLAGVVLGAVASLTLMPIIGRALGADLPRALDPIPFLAAAAFGLLVSFAFSYVPLMRTRRVSPALLFRAQDVGGVDPEGPDWAAAVPTMLAAAGVCTLAVLVAGDAFVVGLFVVGSSLTILLLRAAAWGLQRLLKHSPPLRATRARIALRSVYRPGSPAPVVILSIGLGLAVLLIIALLSSNLQSQLLGGVRRDAPSFVIVGLFADELDALEGLAQADAEITDLKATPEIQAQVVSINGRDPKSIPGIPEEAEFMLTGSIPLTYALEVPLHSTVVEGAWWSADYKGPPLVSLRDTMKFQLGLKLGDRIVFNIGGEPVEATIASFRRFEWQDGTNLMVTFSPGAFDPSAATYMAVIRAAPGHSAAVEKTLLRALPDVTIIPVGDALDQAASILDGLGRAVSLLALLAVVNGLLVLMGTVAAGRIQREADAIVHKVLGATRRDVLSSFVIEYLLLGTFAAIIGLAIGIGVAWGITQAALEVPFAVDALLVGGLCLGAVGLTIAIGAATTWRALSSSPASALRES